MSRCQWDEQLGEEEKIADQGDLEGIEQAALSVVKMPNPH